MEKVFSFPLVTSVLPQAVYSGQQISITSADKKDEKLIMSRGYCFVCQNKIIIKMFVSRSAADVD